MARDKKITESEWRVMDALWQRPGSTTAEVAEALADTGWNRNTVHTFLTRLEGKGYVHAGEGGAPRRYYPSAAREDCVRAETEGFVQRVFRGSAGQLVRTFLRDERLSEDEVAELRALLDSAGRRGEGDAQE